MYVRAREKLEEIAGIPQDGDTLSHAESQITRRLGGDNFLSAPATALPPLHAPTAPLQSIVDTKEAPFRYICQIHVQQTDGQTAIGTGTLIGIRTVLTAAHVLVDKPTGKKVEPHQVRIAPGMDFSPSFGTSSATRLIFNPSFIPGRGPQGEASPSDFALIKIRETLGLKVGFWGGAPPPIDTRGSRLGAILSWRPGHFKVNACGYPVSKGGETQWLAYDETVALRGGLLHYKNALELGHSGCPIWVTRARSNGGRFLFAVHAGDQVRGGKRSPVGVYVAGNMLDFINRHRE